MRGRHPTIPLPVAPKGFHRGLVQEQGSADMWGLGWLTEAWRAPSVAEEYALGAESKTQADWGKGTESGFLGSLPHPSLSRGLSGSHASQRRH